MEKKSRLGRGLDALIGGEDGAPPTGGLSQVPVGNIEENPFQPRKTFDEDELESLSATLQLLAKGLPIGVTEVERLAAFPGVGAALVACIGRSELAIGAQEFTFDETKVGEEVYRHGGDLVDHRITDAVAKVAQIVFAWHVLMEAGELPVVPSLVTVVQIAAELGVINVLIHLGGHFEEEETGWVIAVCASGAIIGCTQGAGEAKIQGGADEPTEAAVDITLRRQLNGMGRKFIVRQPAARGFGKRRGEGLPVVLIEGLGMGDKGVEIKGRELLGGKR